MRNPFTIHLAGNNKTWLQHAKLAIGVAIRFSIASVCFFLHGLFPFIPIPGSYDFEYMIQYLKNMNRSISK